MPWTNREEALVRRLWSTHPAAVIGQMIGKKDYQVRNRASKLGLGGTGRQGRQHPPALINRVLQLYADNTAEQVAEITGLTVEQVRGIVKRARQA